MTAASMTQTRGRREDERFLTGQGRFTDDLRAEGQARAVVLRSPYAHARLLKIDDQAAKACPGILGVFTAADLAADGLGGIPCMFPVTGKDGRETIVPFHPALAQERVLYLGQPVALVVAESEHQARDAAEAIEVDYQELPAVTETARAQYPEAPQIWPEAPGNRSDSWENGDRRATEAAFAKAHHVSRVTLINNRVAVNPMEPRAALGAYDAATGRLTLTTPSQGVHQIHEQLAQHVFKLPPEQIRVLSPDVGGGFGCRVFCNAEQILVLWAARRLGRPVKWTAERGECFFADGQARDHVSSAELALDGEGHFLGLKVSIAANMGAFVVHYGPAVPTGFCCEVLSGGYRIPALHAEVDCVFTNMAPTDTYRGTGRAEALYLLERLVDQAARDLGLSPVEIRRRNLVAPEQLPSQTATGLSIDSGDPAAALEQALALVDWPGVTARKAAAKAEGLLHGIGITTAMASSAGADRERARLNLDKDGGVAFYIGTQSGGHGHETIYSAMLSQALGLPAEMLRIHQGDSDALPGGGGTSFSRSALMGALVIEGVVEGFIAAAGTVAAALLQSEAESLAYDAGAFTVTGTERSITLVEIARAQAEPAGPGGRIEASFEAPEQAYTFPNGCHICELTVDPATGVVRITRYLSVNDFGELVAPQLCEGQVHGGVVQGIGQALLEGVVTDAESGQLLTGSLLDYALPRADDLPTIETHFVAGLACQSNRFGIKGAGEFGAIAAPPTVMNALLDALAPLGVTHLDMPATPQSIWQAFQLAQEP